MTKCPLCHSENVEMIGVSCEEAKQGFPKEDYYGDGSKFVPIGYHYFEYKCLACGDSDADVCIHD